MCGIIGAVAQRDVLLILIEGLKRLEYRGYDSAGIAILNHDGTLNRERVLGKVKQLRSSLNNKSLSGGTGIAHTRWATHGRPSVENAHPHIAGDTVALVHNGIIENYESLRDRQIKSGYEFTSDTDTEMIANQVHYYLQKGLDLFDSVRSSTQELEGVYALVVISKDNPDRMIAARQGSPLIIGVGIGEHFVASDIFALLPVTQKFIFLEDGDIADIRCDELVIFDKSGRKVERPVNISESSAELVDKAGYRHYMLKEIYAQPEAVSDALEGRIINGGIIPEEFGNGAQEIFDRIKAVKIVACGTSYHAGLVAQYWMEELAGIPCNVEIASEFRYREPVVQQDCLFVCISQSGETADTLAALKFARGKNFLASLAVCNVAESSLTREVDLVFLTKAGPEIGVASTKAFTTQLVALFLLVLLVAKRNRSNGGYLRELIGEMKTLPAKINRVLDQNEQIKSIAEQLVHRHHALYLGRGLLLPVAMEGALKLKEISYIHAEAYAAGELKHGPLALIDDDMPVVALVPNNNLLKKLKSNLEEVKARDGELYLFADTESGVQALPGVNVVTLDAVNKHLSPIIYAIPLQLLAYYTAVLKGVDIDQPRNLAKSVTVE